jgi:hypothetical protein
MQTLAQVLATGNDAMGEPIIMSGGDLDMGNGPGTTGGSIFCRTGSIVFSDDASIVSDAGGNVTFQATLIKLVGSPLSLNDGSGDGGGVCNFDGATIFYGNVDDDGPENTVTPASWAPWNQNGQSYKVLLDQ